MQPEDEQKNYWQPEEGEQPTVAEAQQSPADESTEPEAQSMQPEDSTEVNQEIPASEQPAQKIDEPMVSWQASEYIYHEKDFLWFFSLIIITIALMAFAYFILTSPTFTILIAVMAVALIIYSRRPPRTLQYNLNSEGFQSGQQFRSFKEFKAFGVVQDGPIYSIMLVPTKRFAPMMSVYFAEQDGEKIVDIFGHHLPMEELKLDFVDTLMRKLRL